MSIKRYNVTEGKAAAPLTSRLKIHPTLKPIHPVERLNGGVTEEEKKRV